MENIEKEENLTQETIDNSQNEGTVTDVEETVNEQTVPEEIKKEDDSFKVLESELLEWKDKYLRLAADFDNYRKRALKEKIDLTKTASKDVLIDFLPIMDDFERGMKSITETSDVKSLQEGVSLIYTKCSTFLSKNGVKEIDALHQEFNTDLHDALTKIPAPEENLKGKVVDVVQKGYYLNDTIIRFARVVVGE